MKKYIITIIAIATVFHSCTDDMNVVSKDDDVLSADALFSSPAGYKKALAGVYGNLTLTGTQGPVYSSLEGLAAGTSQYVRCLLNLQELTTDEMIWSYENDEGTAELQRNIWTAANPIILGMYSRTMASIAYANDFLRESTPEKLKGRNITDAGTVAEIELYRKEVRVLRAYAYYNMMDLFGKAPMYTENDPLNFAGPEYNRTQLFEFIETELKAVLPDLKPARTNVYGRVDQAVARMILAKIYLNAKVYTDTDRYDDCITMCNEIIAGGYTLKPKYLENFMADNNTSEEMIFTIQSDGILTQNWGGTTFLINGQIGEIENNAVDFGITGWTGALRIRKQFVQKFDGAKFSQDDRNTIGTGTATKQRTIDIADISVKSQGYIVSKFSNKTSTGVSGKNRDFADTDFPLFRLADVYLMYAEATLRGGNGTIAQSLVYVNKLRERANDNATTANITASELNLQFIIDERARELYWEGHRRQDLIRFGLYTGGTYNWSWKGNAARGISIPSFRRLFPIPQASLGSNKNLTQNTGY
ncbi:RagB/SusD family nutrient uptake outer membrane protein [Flavobacterium hibisci]|uniref:RagB/SusD family nutrient uptake outer membrane protein n=1 Tax=Flavobacterium hibisci TaxID=1914462 RepID=UPI001CBD52F8|nr:RagB/SusD family nutrient uptake outer membrane protein [Flavobacterium hibisci]MBZ4043725.1 RagB/SusD family nutrient uptake outer membrane protein [Flavobacterium hibisci]